MSIESNPHYWILWDAVNLAMPTFLTPVLMGLVCLFRTSDPRYQENGHVLTVLKDGQMGFVSLAIAPIMAMEMLGRETSVDLILCQLAIGVTSVFGALLAAFGSIYTTPRTKPFWSVSHYTNMWVSFAALAVSLGIAHYARWHVLG